jgi:DNA-binding XRE family transcriptional regulator
MNSREIRQFRKSQKWTQAQLAEKVGVSRQTVSYWENEVYTPHPINNKMLDELRETNNGKDR